MRILIDARLYGLENSGIGRYLINLVKELIRLDTVNDYTIILRNKYFNELKLPKNWKKVLADFQHYTFIEQLKLPGIIRLEKPDVVHFPHFNVPIFFESKSIVTIHDMTMHKQGIGATNLPLLFYLFKRLPYKFVFRQAVVNSQKIIVPSNAVKDEIIKIYKVNPDKINVTYEGIDEKYAIAKKTNSEMEILAKYKLIGKNYFLYVGNAYPHKNLESAIRAIVDLNSKKDKECIFVIAGTKDKFKRNLRSVVFRNNAKKFIRFIGFVSDEDLRVVYKHSLAFIYPSLSEGFGLQGLEAIASKTILIASDIPVFREIYGSHAFYFNPENVKSISLAMRGVLNMKKEDRLKYSATAQEFIKKYSWREMAKKTIKVYSEVEEGSV